MEAPIDWDTVEVLPIPSERCEALAAPPHERQVARVIQQCPTPGLGRPLLGRGMLLLLNQLLQREPGPPGPPPPSTYSSSSESDEGEWWDDDDNDSAAEGGTAGGAAGGIGGDGRGGIYLEGD